MSFCVSRMAPELVSPSDSTPSGHLPLSVADDIPMVMHYVEMILVFSEGKEPAKVIREALAKVLVPYYLVAGRLVKDSDNDRLRVVLTGEGMLFIEASVDCTLQDVNYVQKQPLMISEEQLLPFFPGETNCSTGIFRLLPIPFMMQVTQFKCRGFSLNQARSRCVIDLSLDYVNQLNDQFMRETGERFTTFEIAVAKLWQCPTRVIDLQPDVTVTLIFPVDLRRLLNHILPSEGTGYYGNCLYMVAIEAPSEQIANASLFDIVKLIKQRKERLLGNRRMLEGLEEQPAGPPTYDKMVVGDWRRLGFSGTDYGWGTPKYVVPLDEHSGSFGLAYIPCQFTSTHEGHTSSNAFCCRGTFWGVPQWDEGFFLTHHVLESSLLDQ